MGPQQVSKAYSASSGREARVLFVDDERQVLEALSQLHGRRYDVLTAPSGEVALDLLGKTGDVAVIVSDMRMPQMNGATFLSRARTLAPDASRILLTGQADMASAIAAVNEGQLFRFLTKPCAPPDLQAAIDAGIRQQRLVSAEKVLLEQTLKGSITTLTEVLALANPRLFGRATRIRQLVSDLADSLQLPVRWQLEVAAMLAHLGFITLPMEVVDNYCNGRDLSIEEREMIARLPKITDQLLGHIPRLEVVRAILSSYTNSFDPDEYHQTDVEAQCVAKGAQILNIALDFDALVAAGSPMAVALGTLEARGARYDQEVVKVLADRKLAGAEQTHILEVSAMGLVPGMVLAEDVNTLSGTLLITAGTEVTAVLMERIRNYNPGTLREPLRVVVERRL